MRIARLATPEGPRTVRIDADRFVPVADPYADFVAGRAIPDAGDPLTGELLAPCVPTVVVGIAQNGPGHASPVQAWLKSPRTVVGPDAVVRLRRDAGQTVAEAEIAVVIGRSTAGLTARTAHEYVLGITAVDDVSSPDRSTSDPRNFESKSGAGYTPLGPAIETGWTLDDDLPLALVVDGVIRAETSARRLPVSLRDCLAYVAGWSELGPGDVVMMGAPFSQAPIRAGENVEVVVGDLRLRTATV